MTSSGTASKLNLRDKLVPKRGSAAYQSPKKRVEKYEILAQAGTICRQ